jgi:hypothetical protein
MQLRDPQVVRCSSAAYAELNGGNSSLSQAERFHTAVLSELLESGLPFLVAGGYAVISYTGARRMTKDHLYHSHGLPAGAFMFRAARAPGDDRR